VQLTCAVAELPAGVTPLSTFTSNSWISAVAAPCAQQAAQQAALQHSVAAQHAGVALLLRCMLHWGLCGGCAVAVRWLCGGCAER
jgi:hypothetical protein